MKSISFPTLGMLFVALVSLPAVRPQAAANVYAALEAQASNALRAAVETGTRTPPQTRRGVKRFRAPGVSLIDLEGLKKLLQHEGEEARPLLVNFWATWCDPCRREFPDLVRIDAKYRARGLRFVIVSLDDPSDIKTTVPRFLRRMRAQMPAFLLDVPDPEPAIKSVDPEWTGSIPATFLFDAGGQIIFKHTGRVNTTVLRQAIDRVMGDE
ncbi:MAG TPA: TlpA disulfide reductase family protein [Pyrinomonadaceae bacterium]|jgi:thiol-disulfide isomerase/thioredoxin